VSPSPLQSPIPTATNTPIPTGPTATPTPTATPVPGTTYLEVDVKIPGIGIQANAENTNPLNTTREATISIINTQTNTLSETKTLLTYSTTNGVFEGRVDLGTGFTGGNYVVKIKLENSLRKQYGIASITAGQVNILPSISLTMGDLDSDNILDI